MKTEWEEPKLHELCFVDKIKHDGLQAPYIGMEDIDSKGTGKFLGKLSPHSVKSSTFKFTKEHLLYGRLRPYLNKVYLPNFDGHCSSEIFPIKSNSNLSKKYLFYWLIRSDVVQKITATSTGARMPRANVKQVLDFRFPLPPLEEQKRIVAILDEAFEGLDRARAHTEANLQNAKELFESNLKTDFENLNDVEKISLSECGVIVSGSNFSSKDFDSSNELNSIKITNVGVKNFVETENAKLPSSFLEQYHKYSIPEGSIVIALTRTIISDGLKIAIVPSQFDGALLNQRVAAIKFSQKDELKDYIYCYLCSEVFSEYVKTSANTLMQPNLSITDLKSFEVPMPTPERRKAIVNRIQLTTKKTNELIARYQTKLQDLDDLRQSLLQKAFAGELT